MHENHEPTCAFCAKYILPFSDDSPLADWGYCSEEMKGREPTREGLREIEEQVRKGDHSFLTREGSLLYQAVGEGCDKFEELAHH